MTSNDDDDEISFFTRSDRVRTESSNSFQAKGTYYELESDNDSQDEDLRELSRLQRPEVEKPGHRQVGTEQVETNDNVDSDEITFLDSAPVQRRRRRSPSLTPPPGEPLKKLTHADKGKFGSPTKAKAVFSSPGKRAVIHGDRPSKPAATETKETVLVNVTASPGVFLPPSNPKMTSAKLYRALVLEGFAQYTLDDNLFFVYKERRVYQSVTPQGLKMSPGGQSYEMTIHDPPSFRRLMTGKEKTKTASKTVESDPITDEYSDVGSTDGGQADQIQVPRPESEFKNIHIRAKDIDEFKVQVKDSTEFSKIYKAFLDNRKIDRKMRLELVFEGETISNESTVQDIELEDGDMVEARLVPKKSK